MFNNNVVNNKRLHIKIDKKLYTELRIMRTRFSMTWDDLLFYLSTNVTKPLTFEDNYIIKKELLELKTEIQNLKRDINFIKTQLRDIKYTFKNVKCI